MSTRCWGRTASTADAAVSGGGRYLVYADGLPDRMNHQVLRFQVDAGGGMQQGARTLAPRGLGVQAGPYEIDLSSVRLHAGVMSTLDVNILEDGKPATDLHPYLGVPAHAVFLNGQNLSYVHVHPMAMGQAVNMSMNMEAPPMPEAGPSPSAMMLHLARHEAGNLPVVAAVSRRDAAVRGGIYDYGGLGGRRWAELEEQDGDSGRSSRMKGGKWWIHDGGAAEADARHVSRALEDGGARRSSDGWRLQLQGAVSISVEILVWLRVAVTAAANLLIAPRLVGSGELRRYVGELSTASTWRWG